MVVFLKADQNVNREHVIKLERGNEGRRGEIHDVVLALGWISIKAVCDETSSLIHKSLWLTHADASPAIPDFLYPDTFYPDRKICLGIFHSYLSNLELEQFISFSALFK